MSTFKVLAARGLLQTVVAAFALVTSIALCGPAHAGATGARSGVVVAVQDGEATDSQVSYYERSQRYQDNEPSRARSVIGGVLGGVVGMAMARNSGSYSRYAASAGGATVGTAIGYAMDRRADARVQQADYSPRRGDSRGTQVIVRLDDGGTVAVFSYRTTGLCPGAKVWLIGGDTLVPAN